MEALQGNSWIANIKGALGWFVLTEYLELWDMLVGVTLNDNEDTHNWKPEASGLFSTRSTYRSFFIGSSTLNLGRKYGSQGYLGNAKHLCGWLFGIVVGLHIVYKKEVFLILSIAHSAIRRRKPFNTSSSHVFLQGNFGMPCCSP